MPHVQAPQVARASVSAPVVWTGVVLPVSGCAAVLARDVPARPQRRQNEREVAVVPEPSLQERLQRPLEQADRSPPG